jgi:hypothetical protein
MDHRVFHMKFFFHSGSCKIIPNGFRVIKKEYVTGCEGPGRLPCPCWSMSFNAGLSRLASPRIAVTLSNCACLATVDAHVKTNYTTPAYGQAEAFRRNTK